MSHFPRSHGPCLVLNERYSKDIREWKGLGRREQILWSQTNLTLTLVGWDPKGWYFLISKPIHVQNVNNTYL